MLTLDEESIASTSCRSTAAASARASASGREADASKSRTMSDADTVVRLKARWAFPVEGAPIDGALVTIVGDRIADIRPATPHTDTAGCRDLGDVAILPGLVNAHTHAAMCLMRGMSDDRGLSPFWESLGRHFFKMEFSQADYLTGVGNKAFIAELMPKFPLYTCFLSEDARAVIGRVHPDTEPALAMLKAEGFSYQGYVDIFDAGPAIEAETAKIRAVRDSQNLVLAIGTPGDDAEPFLVHSRKRHDCRITAAPARMAAGTLVVDPLTAKRLRLSAGDQVRAVPLAAHG